MVKQRIKDLQGTKTIIHIDNPEHYDDILNNTTLKNRTDLKRKSGVCILLENPDWHSWELIDYFKNDSTYKDYKIITSTELIGNNIYELW